MATFTISVRTEVKYGFFMRLFPEGWSVTFWLKLHIGEGNNVVTASSPVCIAIVKGDTLEHVQMRAEFYRQIIQTRIEGLNLTDSFAKFQELVTSIDHWRNYEP